MVLIPDHLRRFAAGLGRPGQAWIDRLPEIIQDCVAKWSLSLAPAFPGPSISFVAPATLTDGTRVVLKINVPERETAREADALRLLDGDGAVRLLAEDPICRALLLERLDPGAPLSALIDEDAANGIAAALLRRFWRPVSPDHPFDSLTERARDWATTLLPDFQTLGRPFEIALLQEAAAFLADLAQSMDEHVLLHQDLHHGNILSAQRGPWVIIDPKPLVGERAFDAGSLLRDRRRALLAGPEPSGRMARRLDLLTDVLAVDRERMRGGGLAQAVELGLWSLEVGDTDEGSLLIGCARLLADLKP